MKRFILIILVVCASPAFAQSCPHTQESFTEWMTFYYQHPDPDNIPCSLRYYSDSNHFSEYKNSRMPAAYFFASILMTNSALTEDLIKYLNKNGSETVKMFALHVFWVMTDKMAEAHLTKAKNLWKEKKIQNIIGKMERNRPGNPLKDGPVTSGDLDKLWAIYFASGNKQAVQQIASVLHLIEDGHGIDIAIGGAARWSLESNSKYHKNILGILENSAKKESGIQKELLIKIINKIRISAT